MPCTLGVLSLGDVACVVGNDDGEDMEDSTVSLEMLFQLVILSLLLDRVMVSYPSDPAADDMEPCSLLSVIGNPRMLPSSNASGDKV